MFSLPHFRRRILAVLRGLAPSTHDQVRVRPAGGAGEWRSAFVGETASQSVPPKSDAYFAKPTRAGKPVTGPECFTTNELVDGLRFTQECASEP